MLPLQRQSGSAKKSSRPAKVGSTYSASADGPNLPPALSDARGSSSCTVDIGGLIDSRTEHESRIQYAPHSTADHRWRRPAEPGVCQEPCRYPTARARDRVLKPLRNQQASGQKYDDD
jgi:hypothetical protein